MDSRLEQHKRDAKAFYDLMFNQNRPREAIERYRSRVDAVTRELEGLSGVLSEKRLEQQRVQLAREELSVRAVEDLGVTEAQLLDGFEPESELAEEAKLAKEAAAAGEVAGEAGSLEEAEGAAEPQEAASDDEGAQKAAQVDG